MVTGNEAATHPPTIRATLTHKPEREEPKPIGDCQAEPETSTDEAEEADGRFDAVATVMRVKDPDRRLGRA